MLFTAERIESDVEAFRGGVKGHMRMVASISAIDESLLDDVAAFMGEAANRDIKVDIEERVSRDFVRVVREGSASLGVCWDSVDFEGLEHRPYRSDELALAVPVGQPLAGRKSIAFAQTLDHEQVGLPPSAAMHATLARAPARSGRTVNYRVSRRIVRTFSRSVPCRPIDRAPRLQRCGHCRMASGRIGPHDAAGTLERPMNPIPVSPQSLRWSTDEVDARRSLDYWIDTVCDQFLELRVDTPLRSRFRASFECMPLGAVTFNVFRAERQHVSRTQVQIARCTVPTFILFQPRHGDVVFRQLGREVLVRPGECVLMNSAEPYEVVCPQAHMAAGLRMPDSWLRRWVPHPERHPAAVFSGGRWNAALCAALASLDTDSCGHLALPGGVVADQMAALLALCLGPTAAGMRSGSLHEDLLRTLRDRLHEPDLSASKLAAEHHVSERTVYYGFASAGTTLAETLVAMRLERARELLADRRCADMPVLDIAARCGFVDPSHFARRFRLRYGQAPAAYRRSVGRPALVGAS